MKIKNQWIIALFIMFFFLGAYSQVEAKTSQSNRSTYKEIPLIAQSVEKQGAKITGWSVYSRQSETSLKSRSELEQFTESFFHKLPKYTFVEKTKKNGQHEWLGTYVMDRHTIANIKVIAYPHKNNYQTYIIYELKGDQWDSNKWTKVKEKIKKEQAKIFHGKYEKFYCVKAKRSAKIKSGLLNTSNKIMNDFQAQPVEIINEKTFVSVSAYTRAWRDAIYTGEKKMNIQVALRTLNGQTTITIGTPIITTEY
ncbi:YwmB family TATA-box binding protein [Terrilactibacillus laevilacticus]|uniref:YwmB family TATA-box binding protein n=1 Tax=Terrilactibacillus laevilacticus TaxID=1380157 RepID=UPI0011474516|nr:YwmB family TATA-box binding protein [Terrilactibacillus laevilacticus]